MIKATLTKTDLVNMLCGRPGPFGDTAFSKYTGNQWVPSWEWDREKLDSLAEEALASMCFRSFEVVREEPCTTQRIELAKEEP